MMNVRKQYSKEEISQALSNSNCYADVFRNLGLKVNGGSYNWLRNLIRSFELSTDHFSKKTFLNLPSNARDYKLPLIDGRRLKSSELKKHLLSNEIEYKCNYCGIKEWMGKSLSLDVDHKSGNCHDNSINNLQFLCPNCHRQKTHNDRQNSLNKCKKCEQKINKKSKFCKSCAPQNIKRASKIDWPTDEQLNIKVWEMPLSSLSKELGVSDNAIRKRCLKRNIILPKAGHWLRTIH